MQAKSFVGKYRALSLAIGLCALFTAGQVSANGAIGDHVNDLKAHIGSYSEEVSWLVAKYGEVVDTYEKNGVKGTDTNVMVEHWEEVDFHSAIETNYVPVYANIWQGIFGVKQAIEAGAPISKVRAEQVKLNQALWQGLGAVKLAAQFQEKGLLAKVQTTEAEPTTMPETLDDIKHRLDRVVAKYAEKLPEAATNIVHDTYLHRFEGVEGALIEQDAALVEDLEKDFNVTLPQALDGKTSVDDVRKVVEAMQAKLDKAKTLLMDAEKKRKDVF
ncbi:hypothetical protein PVT68_05600 [Microbulbifer bruguierae]|uniref:Imelysin-like domain-containing protein n=1 Tax=Microbulbifer bruguierae TaxID=3029061 RepID=A0ABY8NFQ8_9GAMM|nr:hypothetical protein [Microbulbifer bruguierae]WGL17768.1 hypothetical protein PVT68_05600 [Microbulbifer bruguierae]